MFSRLLGGLMAAIFISGCTVWNLYPTAHGGIDCTPRTDGSVDPRCAPADPPVTYTPTDPPPQSPPDEGSHGDQIFYRRAPFVDLTVLRFVSAADAYPRTPARDVSRDLSNEQRAESDALPASTPVQLRPSMVRRFSGDRFRRSQGSRWGDPQRGMDRGREILRTWIDGADVQSPWTLSEKRSGVRPVLVDDRSRSSKSIDGRSRATSRRRSVRQSVAAEVRPRCA
jgi:hypothetical protein